MALYEPLWFLTEQVCGTSAAVRLVVDCEGATTIANARPLAGYPG
jgi:hypothetical protein